MDNTLAARIGRLIDLSPTPFHVVQTLVALLSEQGFTPLREEESWRLAPGGRHYVVRDGSSLLAFAMPDSPCPVMPLRLICAHTDSPALKLKPNGLKKKRGHLLFDVAVYGSPIYSSWFDRELSLAGLVSCVDKQGGVHHEVVNFTGAVARVPNLAIHLNRGVNDGVKINPQEELAPVWRLLRPEEEGEDERSIFRKALLAVLAGRGAAVADWQPLHWDLFLHDTQPSALTGGDGAWLAGPRLDNQLSCFAGALALMVPRAVGANAIAMLACFDHEEVGSVSVAGAAGNFVESVVGRLLPDAEERARAMSASWMLSVDNAHGCHPNYPAQQDENHCPVINQGVVLKSNPGQRYATSAISGGFFKGLCRASGVPVQEFAVRADMACGSTVGPLLSARLGIKTADIGVPTWAMHGVREVAGVGDIADLHRLLGRFYGGF